MYFLRVFSQTDAVLNPVEIAQRTNCKMSGVIDDGWREVGFTAPEGRHPVILERSLVSENCEAQQEIDEFVNELARLRGANASWVAQYVANTKMLYTFEAQTLDDLRVAENLQTETWLKVNGLLQSDIFGFRDELGYFVIAPENTRMKGRQRVAVMVEGKWARFSIDAENKAQYQSFIDCEVPADVVLHSIG